MPPDPESVQLVELNVPAPLLVKVTVPVGVMGVPAEVSVTVAVQVVAWLIATLLGEQLTTVEVTPCEMVTVVEPLLPE